MWSNPQSVLFLIITVCPKTKHTQTHTILADAACVYLPSPTPFILPHLYNPPTPPSGPDLILPVCRYTCVCVCVFTSC